MGEIIQVVFTFLYNLITDKDFYIPLMAVIAAWGLAFYPQKKQNIQHTFFELLRNQNDILNKIDSNGKGGVDYFQRAKENLISLYDFLREGELIVVDGKERIKTSDRGYTDYESKINFFKSKPLRNEYNSFELFERATAEYVYMYFFETNLIYVGHYFRHLFNILKYIEKNKLWINTKFYSALIQAQMSAPELFVLFYNGLRFPKIENFINKYNLIENLSINDLMNSEHFIFYKCKMKVRPIHSWNKLGRK